MKNTIEKIEESIESLFNSIEIMNDLEVNPKYSERDLEVMRFGIEQCLIKMKNELEKL